jgi:hypothetical protein
MQTGASAHFSRAVRDVLSNTCHNRWMGRGGPTAWPLRFTRDLNPPLKTLVYAVPVDNTEAHRIVDARQTTRNHPDVFERMWRS